MYWLYYAMTMQWISPTATTAATPIQNIFTFLDRSTTYIKYLSSSILSQSSRKDRYSKSNSLVKRSSEDLSTILTNYPAIKHSLTLSMSKSSSSSSLGGGVNCSCWRDQLTNKNVKVFPKCLHQINGVNGCLPTWCWLLIR